MESPDGGGRTKLRLTLKKLVANGGSAFYLNPFLPMLLPMRIIKWISVSVFSLFYKPVSGTDCTASSDKMINLIINYEGCETNCSCPNLRCYTGAFSEELKRTI